MKKAKSLLTVLLILPLLSTLTYANGLNLNGMGARASAMGGAYIGLADDFTAIFWNPAGIAQFSKTYFGFYATDIIPQGSYQFDLALINAKMPTKHYFAGMAAFYFPIGENVVAGIGAYTPSGLGAAWDANDLVTLTAPFLQPYEWTSKVAVVSISPAIAFKLGEAFMAGATLNVNYGMFNLERWASAVEVAPDQFIDLGQYTDESTGWGYGTTVGILIKPSNALSLGATFKTASKVRFSGESSIDNLGLLGLNTTSTYDRDITWPMFFGVGLAFSPTQNLTFTADAQYTNWKQIETIHTTFNDPGWAAMMDQSGDDEIHMNWKDAWQLRFGGEYRFNSFALRAGYYYDQTPAPDATMNILLPSYNFHVITFGFGFSLDGLQIDFGFEYLMGQERNISLAEILAMPGIYNMTIYAPNISISILF